MLYRLRDRLRRALFGQHCGGILGTPPVRLQTGGGAAVLSQLQHKDVLLYLLAVKSLGRFLPVGAAHIVDDGSLTLSDRALLRDQVPGVEFIALPEFRSAVCPQGGTWERLLSIAELIKKHYVIQLDSDTLTVATVPEVAQCVAEGRSFTIGTWDRQRIESMTERVAHAKSLPHGDGAHVQVVAEANFDRLHDFATLNYVRGCSGFAGFAPGAFTREFVEDVSRQMTAAIGRRWSEWGSEQVMSNIVVANAPSAMVLPHPKYADCHKMKADQTAFIHFIGSCRFDGGVYARLGRDAIRSLLAQRSDR
jgi:hypothetical protein